MKNKHLPYPKPVQMTWSYKDQLYYNEDQGGLYKYRAVYKVEFDNIIRFLNEVYKIWWEYYSLYFLFFVILFSFGQENLIPVLK